jgi:hypothetical protein
MEANEIKEDGQKKDDELTPLVNQDDDEESSATNVHWNENKFVWDLSELEILNN